jgi:hypothetical protein
LCDSRLPLGKRSRCCSRRVSTMPVRGACREQADGNINTISPFPSSTRHCQQCLFRMKNSKQHIPKSWRAGRRRACATAWPASPQGGTTPIRCAPQTDMRADRIESPPVDLDQCRHSPRTCSSSWHTFTMAEESGAKSYTPGSLRAHSSARPQPSPRPVAG